MSRAAQPGFLFGVSGVSVLVRSSVSHFRSTLDKLALDFSAFPVSLGEPDIILNLVAEIPSELRRSRPLHLYRLPNANVFGVGRSRVCTYPDGVRAECKTAGEIRRFWVAGENLDIVHEVAYTALLSAIGEELDTRGLHRAHALGVHIGGFNLLVLGNSGTGKSSLATVLLRDPSTKIFSDESPMLCGRGLHPFPLRIAMGAEVANRLGQSGGETFRRHRFKPKQLFSLSPGQIAHAGSLDFLMLAGKSVAAPRIESCGRFDAAPELFRNIVVGIGLAQMAEWMLRWNEIPRLSGIGFKRLLIFLRLMAGSGSMYRFNLSEDAVANAACLKSFVENRRNARRLAGLGAALVGWVEWPMRLALFRPIHEMMRRFLLGQVVPRFEVSLRRQMQDERFRLVSRNSLTKPSAYNIFRSDIDCSIIAPDSAGAGQLLKAWHIYEGWRKRWLMLGELEIYMEHELKLQREINEKFGALLERVRLLRKWSQIVADVGGDTEYHREKIRLGRHALFKQLTGREFSEPAVPQISESFEAFLLEQFPSAPRVAAPEGTWRSLFMGWDLSAQPSPDALVLPKSLPILLAVLPDILAAPKEWLRELYKLRHDARISSAYVAVTTAEVLTCRSVARDPKRDSQVLREWLQFLCDEIAVVDPDVAEALGLVLKDLPPAPATDAVPASQPETTH